MTHTLGNTLSHAKKSQRLKIINSHNITSDNNDKNKNNKIIIIIIKIAFLQIHNSKLY